MSPIELDRDARTARYRDEAVSLLPKEFQLLDTFQRHLGRTLSREQLLDAVWPLESPTDRTVDDHVYRLRKKLSAWRDAYVIRTVRGAGYRLEAKAAPAGRPHPLAADPVHAERMRGLIDANLLYGRGDALLALAKQSDVLGFELDEPMRLLVPFLEGRFRPLVHGDAPFGTRVYYLLHLYHLMKPEASRPFVEAALRRRMMPAMLHDEVERHNMSFMLMDWGDFDAAEAMLEAAWANAIAAPEPNLMPYLANQRLELPMKLGDWTGAGERLAEIERLMEKYPFQREEGLFLVLRGVLQYRERPRDGAASIDLGIATLRRSRFVPHLLDGLQTALRYAAREGWPEVTDRYATERERLIADTEIAALLPYIEAKLRKHLT